MFDEDSMYNFTVSHCKLMDVEIIQWPKPLHIQPSSPSHHFALNSCILTADMTPTSPSTSLPLALLFGLRLSKKTPSGVILLFAEKALESAGGG